MRKEFHGFCDDVRILCFKRRGKDSHSDIFRCLGADVLTRLKLICLSALCLLHAASTIADTVWMEQGTSTSTNSLARVELACDLAESAGFAPCSSTCLINVFPEGGGDIPPLNFIPGGRAYLCKSASHSICNYDYGNDTRCGYSAYRLPACMPGIYPDENGVCLTPEKEQGPSCEPHSSGPIYFASGNKYLSETDYRGSGGMPLEWVRTYNGLDKVWRFSFSQRLETISSEEKLLRGSKGLGVRFRDPGQNGSWAPDSDVKTQLDYDVVSDEWIATHADDSVETYNSSGNLLTISNRSGQTITLGYASNQLISITHFSGRSLTLTYDGYGRVDSMTGPAGNAYSYWYDVNGMLEYVLFPDETPTVPSDNPRIQYHYEDVNHTDLVTGITDEMGGRYATYAYDELGRATLSERAGNVEATSVVYNSNGTVDVTNELGKLATYTFTTTNNVRKVTDVAGQSTAMCGATTVAKSYDANGFVDTHTDENGNVTDYTYNARGLVESKTEAYGTADARTTTTTWHASFSVPTQIVRPGQTGDMTYDAAGRVLTRTITDTQTQTVPYVTTNNTRTTTYTYNAFGLVATIDGSRTGVSDVTTYTYDANGDLKTVSNASGHVTEIVTRDQRGLPTAIDDVNDTRTEMSYDERGRLTSRTVKSSQGDITTSFTYDLAGQLIRIDLPSGGYIAYEYDDAHRLIAISNEFEERIEYTLDNAGNATKIEHKGPGGTVLQSQDQVFDELSRLREYIDGASNGTDFDYDNNDNLTDTTDALSRASSQVFDGLDRAKSATDALSGVANYVYDDRGNLTSVTDPRSVVTTYVYDGLDNLIQEVSADAGTTTYTYDSAGNMTQSVDARSITTNYAYDVLNRMTAATYPGATSENVAYTYDSGTDALGRLTQVTDESGSTSYVYDDRGNVTQETRVIDGTTYTNSYAYDLSDQITSTTYPSGRVVNTSRDTQGRTSLMTHVLSSVTEYLIDAVSYDGRGALSAIQLGNGLYQTATYDAAGRLSARTLSDTNSSAPVAYGDSASTVIGADVIIDVIANDSDFNADTLTIYNVTQPAVGSVAINGDQTITFTPSGSGEYSSSFTYQVTDGVGPSNFATVTVIVADPGFVDADGDGLADAYEVSVGLDPNDASDVVADADGDGVDNYAEYLADTDPLVNLTGMSAAVMSMSPLAFWEFDETSGTTAVDSSGNGHTGTYTDQYTIGATSIQPSGQSAEFTDGYVDVPHNTQFEFTSDYSVETLVRWIGSSTRLVYGKKSIFQHNGTQIYTRGNGGVYVKEDSSVKAYSSRTDLNTGQWHHIVYVRRGDDMEIWIDGELDSVTTIALPSLSNSSTINIMGHWYHNFPVDGGIDNLAVYQQALSPSQIKAHFLSQGDVDLDTVPTSFELANMHDPLDAGDATADYDGDGATLYDEFQAGSDPMIHPQGYAASVLADSPEGYWPLDDVTATVVDASANGHGGTYSGTYVQNEPAAISIGSSVSATGSGRIDISNHASLSPAGDYTFEGFLKFSSSTHKKAVGIWSGSYGPILFTSRCDTTTSAGQVTFRDANYNGYRLCSTATGLNDGTWRHYALIRRSNILELWIDGSLDSSLTLPSVTAHSSTQTLQILGGSSGISGSMDEWAMYNTALSKMDIRQRIVQAKAPSQASVTIPSAETMVASAHTTDWRHYLNSGDLVAIKDTRSMIPEFGVYTLNENGNLSEIQGAQAALVAAVDARVVVDPLGISVETNLPSGEILFRRIPNGLATGLVPVASAGLNESWSYTYDAVSNITQIAKPGGNETYGYDVLDRLNTYTMPSSAAVTYSYDAVGNRTSELQSGVTQSHTYGTTDNRLTSQTGATLGYDGAGNRTSDQSGGRTYTYNHRNRLASVVDNSVTVGTYTYNAMGQRVRKVANGLDIDMVYDLGGQLIGEYQNGTMLREYIYMDGMPLAQVDSTQLTYLHTDHLGTPRIGTNANANIVWRWDSDPFGESAPDEDPDSDMNSVTVNLRFPGQYADMETGHYYNYFRDYDPSIGRYTTSDPIGLVGGPNRYAYALNNPISLSDPRGLNSGAGCAVGSPLGPLGCAAGAVVGGLLNIGVPLLLDRYLSVPVDPADRARDDAQAQSCPIPDTVNNNCAELEARVKAKAGDVRRRYFDLLNDVRGLYDGHRDPRNRRGRSGSYAGHQQQLRDAIKGLKNSIVAADQSGCFVDPLDRAMLGLVTPAGPAK